MTLALEGRDGESLEVSCVRGNSHHGSTRRHTRTPYRSILYIPYLVQGALYLVQ
jgi:hypothetical protein